MLPTVLPADAWTWRRARRSKQSLVSVKDTGMGLTPDEILRIWDRLYRDDKSRSERGLGLGLSVVRAIVRAHGGEAQVLECRRNWLYLRDFPPFLRSHQPLDGRFRPTLPRCHLQDRFRQASGPSPRET